MTDALPYIVIVLIMTTLIKHFVQSCPNIGLKKILTHGLSNISAKYLLIFAAYLLYIFFAVFKKIDINLGATDAYYYMQYFNEIPSSFSEYMLNVTTFEPGFSAVCWIIRRITDEYRIMLLIWHSLTFFLMVRFLRRVYIEKYSFLSVFIILLTLISQFNTLRMSISISIVLTALTYLHDEKWVKSLLTILLAISIHISAVIMIPVWIVYLIVNIRKKYPVRQVLIYTILGLVLTVLSLKYVTEIVASSSKAVYLGESSIALGTYVAVITVFALSVIKYNEIVSLKGLNKAFIIMLPICLICIPLQLKIAAMYRLTLYFIPVILALIPSICECYLKKRSSVIGLAVICMLYAYMLYRSYSFFTEEIIFAGPYINTLFIR